MAMKTRTDRAIEAARSVMNGTLASAKREIENAKQRARGIRAARYVRLQPTLIRIFAILDDVKDDDMHVFVTSHGSIYVSLYRQDGFKTDHATALLEYLSGLTDKMTTHDFAGNYSLSRDYVFSVENMDVHVTISVRSDSPTCRKVVTGVRNEEVKTYAIVCD